MRKEQDMLSTMMALKDLGITKIQVDYSGGGDSGQIDDITFMGKDDKSLEVPSDTKDQVEKYAYYLLEDVEDWYNNEGGWGQINIDVINNTYHIENNIRTVEYESYIHDGEIEF